MESNDKSVFTKSPSAVPRPWDFSLAQAHTVVYKSERPFLGEVWTSTTSDTTLRKCWCTVFVTVAGVSCTIFRFM